ncbi:MAG: glycosyltransferase [Gammaproteobacteria bacterium]|nr:glycosyltransferase [Gammaproteobacteria bacterium]
MNFAAKNSRARFSQALDGWRATLVLVFIGLFPIASMVFDRGSSSILLALGVLGILFTLQDGRPVRLTRDEKLLVFVVVFFFLVALLSWLAGDANYAGFRKLGRYLRFLLLVPIYLAVRRVPGREIVWWGGLALGALGSGALALGQMWTGGTLFGPIDDPVAVSAIALAMGFMSLGGLPVFASKHRLLQILPLLAVILGLTASLVMGSRGPWMAVPVLLILALFYFWKVKGRNGLLIIGLVSAFIGAAIAIPATGVADRLGHLYADVVHASFDQGDVSPVGMRLSLWKVAWSGFLDDPLFGGGVGSFQEKVEAAHEAGELSELYLRYGHPLSEYFSVLASRGLLGLVALFLLFAMPMKHFIWAWQHEDEQIAAFAYAGTSLIVAYLFFAIGESIFDRTLPITFYVFSLAVIYGLLRAREQSYLATSVPRQHSLGVFIIAKNEADRIGATLDAVKGWADQIIVLDSGSTDGTVEIARRYADVVKETDWPGFGKQKQRALDLTTTDWVLSLDADEEPTAELRNEIDHVLSKPTPDFDGYRIPRPLIIFGKQVDYGGSWQAPVRLFKRELGRFTDVPVHEKVIIETGRVALMRSPLLHPTWRDYGHAIEKFSEYAWLQTGARLDHGKRATVLGAISRGLYNFIYNYFARAGFLDGKRGLILACLHAQYTFNKYAGLWAERAQRDEEGNGPA